MLDNLGQYILNVGNGLTIVTFLPVNQAELQGFLPQFYAILIGLLLVSLLIKINRKVIFCLGLILISLLPLLWNYGGEPRDTLQNSR